MRRMFRQGIVAPHLRLWSCLGLAFLLLMPLWQVPDEEGLRNLGQWLDVPANVAPADALVVLGGDTQQRLAPALELFQQGMAPELWYTGDRISASWAMTRAVNMGVPSQAIRYLAGSSTWEDTQQVALALEEQQLDSVLIVTSWYHGQRTLCALRHHLRQHAQGHDQEREIQIYYQPVGYEEYGPNNWWLTEIGRKTISSELAKFGFYWITYGLALEDC